MTKNFSIDPICVTMHSQEFCQFLSSTGVILLHNQNCVNEVFSLEKVYASGCSAKVQLIFWVISSLPKSWKSDSFYVKVTNEAKLTNVKLLLQSQHKI